MKYVVDTHAFIWFVSGNRRLGESAKKVLSDKESELVLPAIAFAEAAWIVDKGKTGIPSVQILLKAITSDSRVVVHPLNKAVIEKTLFLHAINEMHDRQIVATALVIQSKGEKVSLLTCDRNITESNLVPIVW
ncbi:MAG: PIN domain-containing protein [Cyanobacteria bacterium P01_D01_bin.36]